MALLRRSYRLCVFEHIDEIDPRTWDSLLEPDDLQASHRFVKACQDSDIEHATYRHVLVYRDDLLVATATLSAMDVRLDLLESRGASKVFTAVRRWLPSFMCARVLFCGLPVSFGESSLRFRKGVPVDGIVEHLARQMEAEAESLKIKLLCFKEFDESSGQSLGALSSFGYSRVHSLPSCSMSIEWHSFEEYITQMRSGYRRLVRKSLRVREEADLTVRIVDRFGPDCDRIFALYEQVMDRADHQLERLNASFFRNLDRYLGRGARAVLLEWNGRLLASAIILQTPSVSTFLLVGIDYELNRKFEAYLNVLLEVVAEAIRQRASRLVLGQTSYAAKMRIGGQTAPLYLFVKCRSLLCHGLLKLASPLLFPATQLPSPRVFK